MSLWILVHKGTENEFEWLQEDGYRFLLEDLSGSWQLEA